MFRLFVRASILFVFIAAAILTTRLLVSAEPVMFSQLFTNPDGSPCTRPCLFGVQIGKTSQKGAITILMSHPVTKHMKVVPHPYDPSVTYLMSRNLIIELKAFDHVRSIKLELMNSTTDVPASRPAYTCCRDLNEFTESPLLDLPVTPEAFAKTLTLGNMLADFGVPDMVGATPLTFGPHMFLYYPDLILTCINPSTDYVSPDAVIVEIDVTSDSFPKYGPWQGFRELARYR